MRGVARPVMVLESNIRVSPMCAVSRVDVPLGDQYGTFEEGLAIQRYVRSSFYHANKGFLTE